MEQLYLKKVKGVRVRYAPSPTGPLHLGGARTALFNFLFAKKYQGTFILRIEDTDPLRSKKEWEQNIFESLRWLGIYWDEGPLPDGQEVGNFGPYRQSERKEIYKKYIKELYSKGYLYWCYCTKEELEALKREQISRGEPPHYNNRCRTLTIEERLKFEREGRGKVLRFKVPSKIVSFDDLIRGKISVDTSFWGDFVVAKDFETPLYNLACVIDDATMQITHVIRGEDHIPNTPKQILLQKALGFPHPKFAHLPLILGPDRSKLSKRHGAVSVLEYKKLGYLPEAVLNFIALLGWHPSSDKEIFSLEELFSEFSLERVQKSGAVFNVNKLNWFNAFYLRKKNQEELYLMALPYFIEAGFIVKSSDGNLFIKETGEKITPIWIQKIIEIFRERIQTLAELPQISDFFFKRDLEYEAKLLLWKNTPIKDTISNLKKMLKILSKIQEGEWRAEKIKEAILKNIPETKRGDFLWPLRVALSGKSASPPPFEIAEILGKSKTLLRIEDAISKLKREL